MNKLGITKIEVLVVALIIGVLGLMAVVAVSTARSRTRDAIRLSDVRSTQAALELYFNDTGSYPVISESAALGSSAAGCLNEEGFTSTCGGATSVYMEVVPATPSSGLSGDVACGTAKNAYCFTGTASEFHIEFELENAHPLLELQAGVNCASESGLDAGACPAFSTAQ